MSAVVEATPLATPAEAPVSTPGTPPPAATKEAPPPEPQVKTFFSKKAAAEKPQDALPDLSKLSPEMQNVYKSFQGDYTRKTQELAEMRKSFEGQQESLKAEREAMQRNHDALMEAIRGRGQEKAPDGQTDPVTQVQALRAEGRYDEADKLMLDYVKQAAMEQIAPMKREAETAKLQTTFQATAMNVVSQNPVVAEYKDEVVKIFDAPTPQMQAIRRVALSSPENVQAFVPMILNAIATEIHARTLESRLDQMAEAKAKAMVDGQRARARSVPTSLVNSSGISRETNGGGGGLAGALSRAAEKLQGV